MLELGVPVVITSYKVRIPSKQYRLIAFVDARNGVPSLVVNILERSNVEVHVDSIELDPQQTNGAWFEWG
ncbi:MAG: hypothetical protein GSR72_03315 [Desulfurococcales archaeon]|nr:hypothetical protein [Desulfurococcales archaeon]